MKLESKMFVSKRYKRVTMHRVLISKLLWDLDNFQCEDLLALFYNQLFLEDLAFKDPTFGKKFGIPLEEISSYLKSAKVKKPTDLPKLAENLKKFIKSKLENFYLPERNYRSQLLMYKRFVQFRLIQPEGTPISQLPPVKYIGKGYTDQGTAKKTQLDGSQRWQDIAVRMKHNEA